jgi:gamma-glutamyltranspeptidase/glutathione hydrolase
MTIGFGKTTDVFARRRAFPMYAERAMVAAAHPLIVDAGLQISHQGGNAFDIAVAAGLAAAVVMPEMCGLGGELFAVYSVAGNGPLSIQASGRSPRGASYDLMKELGGDHMPYNGPHSIAVPGMVDGFFHLLESYGTMPFAQVAEPAIDLARNGYALQPEGAGDIAINAELLSKDEAAAAIFLAHGHTPAAGTRLVQSDLANTLEQLGREGKASFYSGDIAKRMVAYLQSIGSKYELADFEEYESDLSAPYSVSYRGHTVYQTAVPSQGIILLEALNIVENANLADPQSADAIHTMVEAKKFAYADRMAYLAEGRTNPIQQLLSKPYASDRFNAIDPDQAVERADAGVLTDGDTTYLCAVDHEGNMVSLIQSVSAAFGAGIVAGDTGVVMNNRSGRGFSLDPAHPNVYAPGKKSMHTLNAYLIADEQDRPVLVGGTPGGDGQPQWNLQGIVGMIDAGFDVQTAIEQPRWTSWPGTDPSASHNPFELRMESRVDPDVVENLRKRGHRVVEQSPWGGGGAMQIIARDPDTGLMIGGSDARVEGTVLGR